MKHIYTFITMAMVFSSAEVSPSIGQTFQEKFKEKIAIAKERINIAKKVLYYPTRLASGMAPVFIFAHYGPALTVGMGPIGALGVLCVGGICAGALGTEISSLFAKK